MTTASLKWFRNLQASNILDLFLTNSLTLVDSVCVVPGISDHLAVILGIKLSPSMQKLKPRKKCAPLLKSRLGKHEARNAQFSDYLPFYSTGKCTEQLWQEFNGEVDTLISKYMPTKILRGRKNLVTQEIRRKMNQRDHLYQVQK